MKAWLAAHVRWNENFVLVSCGGVEVGADSTVLSRVISGPLAHSCGSGLWDIKGRSSRLDRVGRRPSWHSHEAPGLSCGHAIG